MSTESETPPLAARPTALRRPGLVALLYAYRVVVGVVLALPIAATVGAVTRSYPRRQDELFDPGAMMLIESLRLARPAAPALEWTIALVAVLATLLGLVPLAMVIAGLGRSGRLSATFLAGRVGAHAGTLALLFGLGLVAQGLAAAIVVGLGGKLIDTLKLVPPTEDVVFVGLFAIALAVVGVIGVVRDLGYVAAAHGGHRFYTACVRALRGLRRAPGRVLGGYTWRAALGLAGLALAAWAAPTIRSESRKAMVAGLVLHQAALMGAALARASWLAAAIGVLEATAPRAAAAPEPEPVAPEPAAPEAEPEAPAEAAPEASAETTPAEADPQ